jgi:hypothetical protein
MGPSMILLRERGPHPANSVRISGRPEPERSLPGNPESPCGVLSRAIAFAVDPCDGPRSVLQPPVAPPPGYSQYIRTFSLPSTSTVRSLR